MKNDKEDVDISAGLPSEHKMGISERFEIENPGEIFKFIQETFFPDMPLEMVSDLSTSDINQMMRTANQIWIRMDFAKRYPNAKLQTDAYVQQFAEFLMLAVSKKRGGRTEVLLHAIGGMPREAERKRWFK